MMKRGFPNIIAILVAAGTGTRMKSTVPKQYYVVNKKTLLEYSIDTLLSQSCISQLIVVLHPEDRLFCQLPIFFDPRIRVVIGGKTRSSSVMSALCYIYGNCQSSEWVIIHDAVRPCLHKSDLIRLLECTLYSSLVGGVLATPVRDTIKQTYCGTEIVSCTIERHNLWHVFTPQLFKFRILKNCLGKVLHQGLTFSDEAAVLEHFGYYLLLVPGRFDNVKVTYQEDLYLVEFYLSQFNK